MTWTKLSDDFIDREDLLELTRSARLLYVEGLVWCNRRGLDGRVTRASIARFSDADPDLEIVELEQAGLWVPVEGADAWQMDWSDQESAELVAMRSRSNKERQARWRERRTRHAAGDHSTCTPKGCSEALATSNETGNETRRVTRYVTPSRPDPSRPAPKGAGRGLRCAEGYVIPATGSCCPEHDSERGAVAPPLTEAAS